MNIVVLGAGHSGTSLCMAVLEALGWNVGRCGPPRYEHPAVRLANAQWRATPAPIIFSGLDGLPEPWAIKDPRFTMTLHDWSFPANTCLLWISRDPLAVRASWAQRDTHLWNKTADEHLELAAAQYADWNGHKWHLDYERLCAAAQLVWPDGTPNPGGGLWNAR